jgi:hypothetical protein
LSEGGVMNEFIINKTGEKVSLTDGEKKYVSDMAVDFLNEIVDKEMLFKDGIYYCEKEKLGHIFQASFYSSYLSFKVKNLRNFKILGKELEEQ